MGIHRPSNRTLNIPLQPEQLLPRETYQCTPLQCAKFLLGCRLRWDGCEGVIVETEAYNSIGDPACHTFTRPGARAFVAQNAPGTAYVYLNYGIHWLFNVLIRGGCREGFVLIRALQPVAGLDSMTARCGPRPHHLLCSGPGRLTKAMGINGSHHGLDLCSNPERGIFPHPDNGKLLISKSPRVGISRGKDLPWRLFIRDNAHVSALT